MGHKSSTNDAAAKDVQTMLKKEESAFNMGQRETCATMKDAQTKYSVEECASSTGHIALRKTNLLRLDQNSS